MRLPVVIVSAFCAVLLSGCWNTLSQQRGGVSSSLVDFLYPDGEVPPQQTDTIPNLQVPLRVGLAFVPGRNGAEISEVLKTQLLDQTKAAFSSYDFIKEIVVIPDAYLRAGGGWTSLDQVARLYQTDVMALVSYDQVANADDNKASLLYWTIVGAYVIPGTNRAVQTFVDTAVFDVPTHKLLFRAPGIDRNESTSTLVNLDEDLRNAKSRGFTVAFDDMNKNLDSELGKFRERIKTEHVADVTARNGGGTGGGGSAGPLLLLALFAMGLAGRAGRRHTS
ncbi:MAG: rhombotarget lipoprotein [Gammaproteobacteria bacterium]